MSKIKFKIEKITSFEKTKNIVLDGVLLEGKIVTGSLTTLNHDEAKNEILVKGVVLGEHKLKASNTLSFNN